MDLDIRPMALWHVWSNRATIMVFASHSLPCAPHSLFPLYSAPFISDLHMGMTEFLPILILFHSILVVILCFQACLMFVLMNSMILEEMTGDGTKH